MPTLKPRAISGSKPATTKLSVPSANMPTARTHSRLSIEPPGFDPLRSIVAMRRVQGVAPEGLNVPVPRERQDPKRVGSIIIYRSLHYHIVAGLKRNMKMNGRCQVVVSNP